jgi:hypothetical protein
MKPPSATFCWSIRLYLTTRRCRATQQTIVRVVGFRLTAWRTRHCGYYRERWGTIGNHRALRSHMSRSIDDMRMGSSA